MVISFQEIVYVLYLPHVDNQMNLSGASRVPYTEAIPYHQHLPALIF